MPYNFSFFYINEWFSVLNEEFPRINRLPPYVFNIVNDLKMEARRRGEDIIDFGMGNPDQPTPQHIVDKMIEAVTGRIHTVILSRAASHVCVVRSVTGIKNDMKLIWILIQRPSSRLVQRKDYHILPWLFAIEVMLY